METTFSEIAPEMLFIRTGSIYTEQEIKSEMSSWILPALLGIGLLFVGILIVSLQNKLNKGNNNQEDKK
jgi:hypothetical protein